MVFLSLENLRQNVKNLISMWLFTIDILSMKMNIINHIISEFAWVQYAYIEKKIKRLFWNLHILLNIYWYIKTVKAIPLSPLEQIPIKREKTSDGLDSIANVFTDFLGPLSISADSRLFRQ